MAAFDPILADIRFGCGLSPQIAPAPDAAAFLETLDRADDVALQHPIESFDIFRLRMQTALKTQKLRRDNRGTPEGLAAKQASRGLNVQARKDSIIWMAQHLGRRIVTAAPFRERLEAFWADHFTAVGKLALLRRAASPYSESAIRPHLGGLFEDLLISAVTHPLMVHYLDQERSIGPNSVLAQKRKSTGLNENLAREILELHTIGVGGPYSQADVREFAELLTGLTFDAKTGRKFRKDMAEPGAETVLGIDYGGTKNPNIRDIEAALRDLARHPATARHLARKLAVHFVSDVPDESLVQAIERAFLDSGTDLRAGYAAMLAHPAAWDVARPNVKPPFDFISSALRALAIDPAELVDLKEGVFRQRIQQPMTLMGHIWQKPDGPDGLPEADEAWITPQALASRLQWAVAVPQFLTRDLPDPRVFVTQALGDRATPAIRFAANAAESRADGLGLILASPAFQRM